MMMATGSLITPVVSELENNELCRIPSMQEIKATIFDMNSKKTLGPDELPTLFYKKYWNIVGTSVTEAI